MQSLVLAHVFLSCKID